MLFPVHQGVFCRQSLSGTQADARLQRHIQVSDKWLSEMLKVSFENLNVNCIQTPPLLYKIGWDLSISFFYFCRMTGNLSSIFLQMRNKASPIAKPPATSVK